MANAILPRNLPKVKILTTLGPKLRKRRMTATGSETLPNCYSESNGISAALETV
jgi:hypothetical protein